MFQTIQCTGMLWAIHLHTPCKPTKTLAYGPFADICGAILPTIPIKVLPDGVYLTYQAKLREIRNREKKAGIR